MAVVITHTVSIQPERHGHQHSFDLILHWTYFGAGTYAHRIYILRAKSEHKACTRRNREFLGILFAHRIVTPHP